MNILKKDTALKLMIGLLSLVILFHFCVLFEIISYKIVWAGKINSIEEMRVLELISILVNILLIVVLYIKYKNISNQVSNRVINLIIWIFVFLFAINSIGNLFSKSLIEFILGTGLTLISSLLCWIIVREDKKQNANDEMV